MQKIIQLLDMVIEYYDKLFRMIYGMWMQLCVNQETLVVTLLEFGVLALLYWLLIDKKTKDVGWKWIGRVLIAGFILYGVFRKLL